ncbi:GIN domain-containing protein [Winogradskyella poriferorum]|uniref:GIN domain-containing protein n=1 Tax=Winogradskyella poriferorum TaxID=307627 RepID=UPI003D652220
MKKQLLVLIFMLATVPTVLSQSTQKIKGDRNVTIKQTFIDDFETIVVDGDFAIEVVYNSKPSVEIEADDNLHDVIQFNVVDSVLSFSQTMRITSKKKLNIKVNYGDALSNIQVKGDGEIRSLTSMELGDVTLSTSDNSRAYLNINSKTFGYKSSGKSKTRLNLTTDSSYVELSDTSKLDALIKSRVTNFDLYQRSDAVIEGISDSSLIRVDNSSNLTGSKFEVKQVDATLEDNSDITIAVEESIVISASGNSEVYLYGNPSITINKLEGTSKLQKKKR